MRVATKKGLYIHHLHAKEKAYFLSSRALIMLSASFHSELH